MGLTLIIPIIVSLVMGVCLFLWGKYHPDYQVNSKEFAIGLAVTVFMISPFVSVIGGRLAVDDKVNGYKEFWNGSVIQAPSEKVECQRDGSCKHTYRCDPYEVYESYQDTETETYTDSQGRLQTRTVSVTRWHWVTHYHECPYATVEYSYWLVDSFGNEHRPWNDYFATQPIPWRSGEGIPGDVPRGVPQEWAEIRTQIEKGDPPPATKSNDYTNYILASTDKVLKRYSPDVAKYQKLGLLPPHTANWRDPIQNGYRADKVAFAKVRVADPDAWQKSLGHLNAALGMERQGDMHIVVVPAHAVSNPDGYINALMAYWQGSTFGKRALGKNAIGVAIGLNRTGTKVLWVRAKTGMPVGNGEMSTALSFVRDVPADPETLIGHPKAKWDGKDLTFRHSDGVIEKIVLDSHPFLRACMQCKDKTDHGTSFTYLKKDVKVTTGAKWAIVLISIFLNALVWAGLAYMPWFEGGVTSTEDDYPYSSMRFRTDRNRFPRY